MGMPAIFFTRMQLPTEPPRSHENRSLAPASVAPTGSPKATRCGDAGRARLDAGMPSRRRTATSTREAGVWIRTAVESFDGGGKNRWITLVLKQARHLSTSPA